MRSARFFGYFVGVALVLATIVTAVIAWDRAGRFQLVLEISDPPPTPTPWAFPTSVRPQETPRPLPTRTTPVIPAGGPVGPFLGATATPQPLDLNLDFQAYTTVLGLSNAQAGALFRLRCAPAVPPFSPYPISLEGCGPDAMGIVVLDQVVDAGVMTEEEVIDLLVGKVRQTWVQ